MPFAASSQTFLRAAPSFSSIKKPDCQAVKTTMAMLSVVRCGSVLLPSPVPRCHRLTHYCICICLTLAPVSAAKEAANISVFLQRSLDLGIRAPGPVLYLDLLHVLSSHV